MTLILVKIHKRWAYQTRMIYPVAVNLANFTLILHDLTDPNIMYVNVYSSPVIKIIDLK